MHKLLSGVSGGRRSVSGIVTGPNKFKRHETNQSAVLTGVGVRLRDKGSPPRRNAIKVAAALAIASAMAPVASAQTVRQWNSTATSNVAYLTVGNWTPNTTFAGDAPLATVTGEGLNTDIMGFATANTGTTAGINMNNLAAAGGVGLVFGGIDFTRTSTASFQIGNSSTTVNGILQLNGATINSVANTLIRCNSGDFTVTNVSTGATNSGQTLGLRLGITNGVFDVSSARTLTIASIVSEAAANSGFTKTGAGTMTLTGANTYSGVTAVTGGVLNLGGGTANGSLSSTTLTLGGGDFAYTRTGTNTQGFTSTSIGGNSIITGAAGNTLNLGTVTRTGTFNRFYDLSTTGLGVIAADTASNNAGIMAGFTVGDSWAVANGTGVAISGLGNASYTLTSVAGTTATSYANANIDVDNSAGALDASFVVNTLRFSAASANTLTLTGTTNTIATGGILVGSGVGANLSTITGGTLAGANTRDLNVIQNNTSGGLTISSVIGNNTGATALTKSGAGLLTLGASNTFTGGVFIHGGTLRLGVAGALNGTAGSENAVTFGAGTTGTLSLNGINTIIRSLATDSSAPGSAVVENGGSSNVSLTIGNSGNASGAFAGVLRDGTGGGKLALVKAGTGTLTLSGANTHTGGTTINAGIVGVNSSTAFGTGKVTVAAGTPTLNYQPGLTIANDIAVNVAVTMKDIMTAANTITFSGVLSGTGNINITNNGNNGVIGEFAFTNTANTWTGNVVFVTGSSAGDDRFSFNSLGDGGNFTLQKGGHQNSAIYTGSSNIVFNTRTINVGAIVGTYDGGGTTPVNAFTNNGTGTVTFNANMTVGAVGGAGGTLFFNGTNAGANTFAGAIGAGTGGVFGIGKTGTGKWILTGSNSYAGETLIRNGTLSVNAMSLIANNQPLGKNAVVQLGHQGDSGTLEYIGSATSTTDKTFRIGNTVAAQVGGGTINNNGTGTLTFSAANFNPAIAAITATRTLTLGGSNTGDNTISGVIQDNVASTGKIAITKSGAGTWVLAGSNTYTGVTTISNGKLALDFGTNDTSKLADASALTLGAANATSTLELRGGTHTEVVASTTLTAGGFNSISRPSGAAILRMGAITFGAGATIDFSAPNIASTSTANAASGILSIGATVGGADWATNSGTLEGSSNNFITAYTAYSDVQRLTPGVIPNTTTANVRIVEGSGSSGSITLAAATTAINTLNQSISGGTGSAAIDLPGQTLRTNSILVGPTAGSLTIGAAGGTAALSGTLTNQTGASGTLNLINNSANDLVINSVLADNSTGNTYVKTGTGTVVLAGENTNTGTVTVAAGTLSLTGNRTAAAGGMAVLGGATLNLSGGNFSMAGNTLTVGSGTAGTGVVNQNGASLSFTGGTQILVGNGVVNGTYNLSAGTLSIANVANRGIILGVNTGTTGIFNLSGTGTLTMAAGSALQIGRSENTAANTTTGNFVQTGGTANVSDLRLGGSTLNSASTANSTALLDLSAGVFAATSFTQLSGGDYSTSTINISGTADVTLPAFPTGRGTGAVSTINFNGGTLKNAAASATYMGGLTNAFIQAGGAQFDTSAGSITIAQPLLTHVTSTGGGLTKLGSNTLTLTGASTYTGATTVNAGTLLINGSVTSSVTLPAAAAASTTVGGSGSITGTLAVNGGRLAPGNSPGILTVTGVVTLGTGSSSATYSVELGGNTPGNTATNYDQLVSSGSTTITQATLEAVMLGGFTPSASDVFYIAARGDASPHASFFTGLPEGGTYTFTDGSTAQITYQANWSGTQAGSSLTGGNDVALYNYAAAVPEPGSVAVLAIAGMGLLAGRRRRKTLASIR